MTEKAEIEYLTTNAFGDVFRIRITKKTLQEIEDIQERIRRMNLPKEYEVYVEREFGDFDTLSDRNFLTLRITRDNYVIGQYWEEGFREMFENEEYIGYCLREGHWDEKFKLLTDEEKERCLQKHLEEKEKYRKAMSGELEQ